MDGPRTIGISLKIFAASENLGFDLGFELGLGLGFDLVSDLGFDLGFHLGFHLECSRAKKRIFCLWRVGPVESPWTFGTV